jgi:hypothetical protein
MFGQINHISILELNDQIKQVEGILNKNNVEGQPTFYEELHYIRQLHNFVKKADSYNWQQFELFTIQPRLERLKLNIYNYYANN